MKKEVLLFAILSSTCLPAFPQSKGKIYYYPQTHYDEINKGSKAWASQRIIYLDLLQKLNEDPEIAIFHEEAFFNNSQSYADYLKDKCRNIHDLLLTLTSKEKLERLTKLESECKLYEAASYNWNNLDKSEREIPGKFNLISSYSLISDPFTEKTRWDLLEAFPKALTEHTPLSDHQKELLGEWGAVPLLAAQGKAKYVFPTEEVTVSQKVNDPKIYKDSWTLYHAMYQDREESVVKQIQSLQQSSPSRSIALIYGANHDYTTYFNDVVVPIPWDGPLSLVQKIKSVLGAQQYFESVGEL